VHAGVDEYLDADPGGYPDGDQAAVLVGGAGSDYEAAPHEHEEEGAQGERAYKAELLGNHREYEVAVAHLEVAELALCARHVAQAEPPARPGGDARLEDIVAVAQQIGLGVEEYEQAVTLVALHAPVP